MNNPAYLFLGFALAWGIVIFSDVGFQGWNERTIIIDCTTNGVVTLAGRKFSCSLVPQEDKSAKP